MLRELINKIAFNYPTAKENRDSKLARFIYTETPLALSAALKPVTHNWKAQGSHGKGRWAIVPWLAVLDPHVTTTAREGYYIVYLFSADMKRLYLSLNQGTTSIRVLYGENASTALRENAQNLRKLIPEYKEFFSDAAINLGSKSGRPLSYEQGHIFGKEYSLPLTVSEESLAEDLQNMARLYLAITERKASKKSHTISQQSYQDVLVKLGKLEETISKVTPLPAQLGHNKPPEDIVLPYTDYDAEKIREIITLIKTKGPLSKDHTIIQGAPNFFSLLSKRIRKCLTLGASESIKGFCAALGGAAALGLLSVDLDAAAAAIRRWLELLL